MTRNYQSNPAILKEARDYLDGLMLGDGHIICKNSKTGYYQQSCKHKNWLDKIDDDLYEYGIECGVSNGRIQFGGFNAKSGSIEYTLHTRSYIEFKKLRDRFYIKWYDIDNYNESLWHLDKESGEYFIWQKIIPEDICLSPGCLANEYLGDGSIYKHKHQNGYCIHLSTDGFLRKDVVFLSCLLAETLDIKCGIDKAGQIGIHTQADISTFINYIKDYKVDCYAYKFPDSLIDGIYR